VSGDDAEALLALATLDAALEILDCLCWGHGKNEVQAKQLVEDVHLSRVVRWGKWCLVLVNKYFYFFRRRMRMRQASIMLLCVPWYLHTALIDACAQACLACWRFVNWYFVHLVVEECTLRVRASHGATCKHH
jgi:hypothetical protein